MTNQLSAEGIRRQVLVLKMKHDYAYIEIVPGAWLKAFGYLDEAGSYCNLSDDDRPSPEGLIPVEILNSTDPDRVALREKKQKAFARELHEWEEQRKLYDKAKAGDERAAKALLVERQDYEYEDWSLEDLE